MNDKEFSEEYFCNFDSGNDNVFLDPDDLGEGDNFANLYDNWIPPFDRTIEFKIDNLNAFPAPPVEAILFGAFADEPQPAGIAVNVVGAEGAFGVVSPQTFLQNATRDNPILFWGLKYLASDPAQLSNPMRIIRSWETGSFSGGTYQLLNYVNPTNFQNNLTDDPTFRIAVDGRTSIRVLINADTTVTMILTIKSRRNVINKIKGIENDLQIANYPRPSGNTTFDTQVQLMKLRSRAWGQKELTE
jgi:hypothetical protein